MHRSSCKAFALESGIQNFLKQIDEARAYTSYEDKLEEPQVLLTKTPRIPGLDGRKMSKSYGNAITLSESDDDIRKKTKVMVTTPRASAAPTRASRRLSRLRLAQTLFHPGNPRLGRSRLSHRGIGCIECKSKMADHLIQWIAPVRERRLEYEKHPARVLEIIDAAQKQREPKRSYDVQSSRSRIRLGQEKGEIAGA